MQAKACIAGRTCDQQLSHLHPNLIDMPIRKTSPIASFLGSQLHLAYFLL